MRMRIDERLVKWTDSFMRDRKVIMSVDGEPMEVTTGLPQGSPTSPVLFAIYVADIHKAVEGQVEDSRGISFVDGVARGSRALVWTTCCESLSGAPQPASGGRATTPRGLRH